MTRRGRHLSEEERRLWELVQRTANPLRAATEAAKAAAAEAPAEPAKPPARKRKPASNAPVAVPPKAPAEPAGPARFDRRTLSRLTRGVLDIDARLDLHGMTRTHAHRRLRRFLEDAQAEGARLVLVITGKGTPGGSGDYVAPERGVLRRAVPEWLASPELRHLVTGFDEAGRRHGGGGAIYVRLRRRRGEPA